MDPVLNRLHLAANTCFGCGLENPAGLRIEVFRNPAGGDGLQARFTPTGAMAGFPGIVHGGAIFTALDCLSTWVSILLGPNRGAAWVLRSATTVYHRPAPVGEPLTLKGWIKEQGGSWDPLIVQTEARRVDGSLCVEGELKVVPLSAEKLTDIAEIGQLPENWRAFLAGGR
jgi:acyl-CoA thioesterase FadM